MNILNKSILIEDKDVRLYGIYRGVESPTILEVLIPAVTGTRIGPQRMFVEIANYIGNEIGTVCFDLPSAGDSIDKRILSNQNLREYYNFYLSKIYEYLKHEYPKSEIVLCSISAGCMPILEFSEINNLNKVILLSPNHLSNNTPIVNKRNVHAYFNKIFQPKTWKKLFLLKLSFDKIFKNIFVIKNKEVHKKEGITTIDSIGKVNLLCIFGQNDPDLQNNRSFWNTNNNLNRFYSYKECLISNSDHSFMGWGPKTELIKQISDWIK